MIFVGYLTFSLQFQHTDDLRLLCNTSGSPKYGTDTYGLAKPEGPVWHIHSRRTCFKNNAIAVQFHCIQRYKTEVKVKLENGIIPFWISAVEAEPPGGGSDSPETARRTLSQFQMKVIIWVHNLMAVHCWKWINQTSTGKCTTDLVSASQLLEVYNGILSWSTASRWLDGIRNITHKIFVVMGRVRICPEEGGTKSIRSQDTSHARHVVLIAVSLTATWETEARCVMPGYWESLVCIGWDK